MSKKKKKSHGQAAPMANTSAANKPAAQTPEIAEASEQSLREMFAFAHEEEQKTDSIKTEEPKKEVPKVEEPKKEVPKVEEPEKEVPKVEEPEKEVPKAEEPEKEVPKAEEPKKESPKTEEPKKEAPKAEEPKKEAPKAEEPKKETPKTEEHKNEAAQPELPKTAPDGRPLTEDEARQMAAAEDALDRDLASARKKRLQEEAFYKHQRDAELKREAERIEQAKRVEERHIQAREAAQKKAAAAAAAAADPDNIKRKEAEGAAKAALKNAMSAKYYNKSLNSMASARALVVCIVVLVIGYVGAHLYVNGINNDYYTELDRKLTNQNRVISTSSVEYSVPEVSPFSEDDKIRNNLTLFLVDSDKDGLTDKYELEVSGTNPKNADSDGDGVMDGPEVRAGLDPLNPKTDGETPDGTLMRDIVLAHKQVSAKITGILKTTYTTLTVLDNNSIQGTPGLIGSAYEFYSDKPFEDCELTFTYTDEQLSKNSTNTAALAIYRFNQTDLVFEKLTSEINTDTKSVSAHIDRSGIYALCDTAVLMQKKQTNIFFLIDNSGSMYPEELCANSEENDVEFKRLDFATNLIDMLGAEANYGAAEFSGNYTPIISINSDLENTKNVISDIRNKDQVFSGTNIAGAITNAVKAFGTSKNADKNYLILLTDGIPSTYDEEAERAAVQSAIDNNITIFTIGLGKYIDADYLLNIATKTNGQFFQASNADALSNIYEKIQHFMSYNQITIDGTSGQKGFIIADCGFNAQRDGLGYVNFRTEFAPNGADVGIAGLIRAYYTGELQLSAGSYQCIDGTSVEGYDVSGIEEFRDGKVDLKNIEIASLTAYNKYLNNPSKWDFGKISGGVLHFNDEMTDTIIGSGLKIYTAPYDYVAPEETVLQKTLRAITFRNLKEFNEYDCVLIDSTGFSGNDSAVMGMIRWYCSVPKSDKCVTYDFAYQGQDAFDMLINELTTGSPAVITVGGSAMNAVRLVRDVEDPNSFVLDAYDSNSPDRLTKIYITRNPIYDGGQITSFQYCASRGGSTNEPFTIIVSK